MKPLVRRSFSLIELMAVVAIIAFLGALAIPNYFKYLAKAKQAEVALNLSALHAAQQSYWNEHGCYSTNFKEIGWEPAGAASKNFNYTYGFGIPGAQEGVNFFVGKLNTPASHIPEGAADKTSFKAYAVADLQGKGKMDVWTIDESRTMIHSANGIE